MSATTNGYEALIAEARAARAEWGIARRGGYNHGARRMAASIQAILAYHDAVDEGSE